MSVYTVCMQPMRRSAVVVESGLLSTPMALTHAMNSAFTTGAKLGRNAVRGYHCEGFNRQFLTLYITDIAFCIL